MGGNRALVTVGAIGGAVAAQVIDMPRSVAGGIAGGVVVWALTRGEGEAVEAPRGAAAPVETAKVPVGGSAAQPIPPAPPTTWAGAPGRPGGPFWPEPEPVVAGPREPSAVERWVRRWRETIASDLAVHGLAYLGVLLLFAGLFGFIVFSFGTLGGAERLAVEGAVPLLLLSSAWFLRRRAAPVVATTLGLLGGLLLPVVAFASFVDGQPFPPDLRGDALAATLAGVAVLLAAAYALYCWRVPDASLRYLVAPLLWTAAWAAALPLARDRAGVIDLRNPSAGQLALTSVAVAATAVLVRLRSLQRSGARHGRQTASRFGEQIGDATRVAVVPGIALVYGMTLALAAAEGWPAWPVVVAGVSALMAVEALATVSTREGREGVALLQATVLGASLAAVAASLGRGRGGLATALAYAVLAAWQERRRPGPIARVSAAAGILAGLGLSLADPWASVAAFGVAGLVIIAGRGWRAARLWAASAAWAWAAWRAGDAAGWSMDVRALGGSAAAVLVVLGAFLPRVRRLAGHLGLIGSLLALASLAVARPGSRASLAALAAWCVVWAVAAVEQERGEAPVVALLRRALGWSPDLAPASRLAGVVPALILAASVPFLVLRAGELGGVLRGRPSWSGVALSLLAVADAAAASWLARRRATARLLAAAAVALALAGIGFAGPDSWPLTLAVAGPIAVAVTLRRELRHPVVTWIAWAASGALAILGAGRAGVADRDLDVVGLAWGAVLLAGGLLLDDLRSGRRAPGEVVRNLWLAAPVTLGAFAAPVAFGVVVIARPAASGWWELAGAAFSLLVALQLRAGVVSVISWALLTLGAATLAPEPWSPSRHPAVLVPWAAALVVAGSALERLSNTRGPRRPEAEPGTGAGAAGWDAWLRWDLPPLAVAHGVALAALVRSADPAVGGQALTWAGVGALCLAVAAWRRSAVYAAIGTVLVLVGAVAGVGAVRAVEGMATVAGVTTLAGLVLWRWRPASPWLRPILLLSGAAGLAAVAVALSVPPRRDLLEIALVVTGLQAAAAGIVLRWRPGLYASPCLLCGAWLLFAAGAFSGEPQWFTVPVGVALLAVVGIARSQAHAQARRDGTQPAAAGNAGATSGGGDGTATGGLLPLEYAGMAFVVGAGIVEAVTRSPARGLSAVAFGAAVAAWGGVTRVRRRVLFGAVAAVLATLLLVLAPLAELVPRLSGPAIWVALALAGTVMLLLATGLERGRARVSGAIRRLGDLMAGWE